MNTNKLFLTSALTLAIFAGQASAAVPNVEKFGKPAITVCPVAVPGQVLPPTVHHSDKIVFEILDNLQAANPADQVKLNLVPLNTALDIKVQDDPTTVADIKGKVLTFLSANTSLLNYQLIKIISVEYAVAVCPPSTGVIIP